MMRGKTTPPGVLLLAALTMTLCYAQEPTLVRLSDAVGDTVDLAERDSFDLFPSTAGFQNAVIIALPGPEFFAKVKRAGADSTGSIFLRIMPNDLERIRFLIANREYVAAQQRFDSTYAQALAAFWQMIEERPLRNMAGEPAFVQRTSPEQSGAVPSFTATTAQGVQTPPPEATPAGGPPLAPVTAENRYNYTLHGTTLGSAVGGCIGSYAGISQTGSRTSSCLGDIQTYPIYTVNYPVFLTAACGLTALGSYAGYALGDKLDRRPKDLRPAEGKSWRTGCAVGAAVPGVLLGASFFVLAGITHYGRTDIWGDIGNDPSALTIMPMALTGLCITVELTTIGYHIGRAIDRANAKKAAKERLLLGR